ncbi:RNA polymerase sigma factor, partial [Nonlabens ulvanivorans]
NKRMPKFSSSNSDFDIFDVISNGQESTENEMISLQVQQDVKKLIEELPDDQKEVLIMRMYKDMSFKEIAECTDVSINTALGRMRYALINLRKVIDKHNIILTN